MISDPPRDVLILPSYFILPALSSLIRSSNRNTNSVNCSGIMKEKHYKYKGGGRFFWCVCINGRAFLTVYLVIPTGYWGRGALLTAAPRPVGPGPLS